ncbi:MAG: hypothetical protein ACT6TH_15150 [Brevundimonas sp.]|uniref:hypothetical protein n=1 Tax=Brevundimonas sp. TaxID=1871086 RepID=UPI00403365B7
MSRIFTLNVRQTVDVKVDVIAETYDEALAIYGANDVLDRRHVASDPQVVKTAVRPLGSRIATPDEEKIFRRNPGF